MVFANVVERVYGCGSDAAGWRTSLSAVSKHCQASSAVLMVRNKTSGQLDFCVDHGLSDRYQRSFNQQYRDNDLRLSDLLRHPVGSVRTDTMLADYDAYQRSPAYQTLYRKIGTEHALGGFVFEDSTRSFAIRVFRSGDNGAFTTKEIERFRQLGPHLRGAISQTITALHAQAIEQLLARVLALPKPPCCILAADGSVISASPNGQRLLDTDHDLLTRLLISKLPPPSANLSIPAPFAVPLSCGEARIVPVHVVTGQLPGASALIAALVFSAPATAADRVQFAALAYNLTPAEQRLVGALCEGNTLAQAATSFGVKHETVKSQLRDVFQKMHVQRQADLVRQVLLS